jgi:SRP54-type protein, GTPase domain
METKTYFASSVPAAMDVARRELGPDAMLVSSGPSPEAARPFGRLEVIFAWEPSEKTAYGGKSEALPQGSGPSSTRFWPAETGTGRLQTNLRQVETNLAATGAGPRRGEFGLHAGESGLDDIRLEISALRASIGRPRAALQPDLPPMASQSATTIDTDAVRSLCDAGLEEDSAQQIVSVAGRTGDYLGDSIVRELTARLPVAPFTPLRPEESRTLAFVGPAGRGKTTSLIKIAVRYGLASRIPTRIYSAGAHGVGAAEQMARYAAIIGVPFEAIESFESLDLVLQGERWKGLILIDTPGCACSDRHEMDSMARFFSRRTGIERHLVIRAEARSADIQNMLSRYAAIQPSRLLFTGLDEVKGLGAAADTILRSGIGATFFGTGPRIPDDIEEVSIAKLARSLWAPKALAARAA